MREKKIRRRKKDGKHDIWLKDTKKHEMKKIEKREKQRENGLWLGF